MRRSSVILTSEDLKSAVARLMEADAFVFDVETIGEHRLDPRRNIISWIAFATAGFTCVIPMGHQRGKLITPRHQESVTEFDHENLTKAGKPRRKTRKVWIDATFTDAPEQLWPGEVFSALEPLFFSDRRKIAHNLKFDALSAGKYFGEPIPGPYFCTQIGAWVLDPRKTTNRDLAACIKREFNFEWDDKGIGKQVEIHPFEDVAKYQHLDVKWDWLLYLREVEKLAKRKLTHVQTLEMDVLEGLVQDTERVGAQLDIPQLNTLAEELEDKVNGIRARVWKIKPDINLNSPQQLAAYLYTTKNKGGRGLKPLKYTCGCAPGDDPKRCRKKKQHGKNYSTDAASLTVHSHDPFVSDLLEFAEWDKILGTYLRPWQNLQVDGRIFTNFKQHGTETGRFSSAEPNLQNVPRRGDKAKLIRSLFIAPPGRVLVVADYSQIELRVIAHFSKDKSLMRDFIEGRDPHTTTASLIFDREPDDLEEWMRDVGKTMNFGVAYGAGPGKVMEVGHMSERKARRLLNDHREAYPRVYRWKQEVISQARRDKYVKTIIGRQRPLPYINSPVDDMRSLSERQAVNTRVQGSAADIIKIAMVRLNALLPEDMNLVLSIHDELIVEAPEDKGEEAVTLMQEAMSGAYELRVPLTADAKIGNRWDEAK